MSERLNLLRKTFCTVWRGKKLALLVMGWLVAVLAYSAAFAPDQAVSQADGDPNGVDQAEPDQVPIQAEQKSSQPVPEQEEDLESASAHQMYAIIADAWLAQDHKQLAEVVAEDGVVIAIAPDRKRDSRYSPDQAFYFFKNLFQFAHTDSFEFRRLQDEEEGGVIHAVADWKYRRTGSEALVGERFIFTLTSSTSGWGLIEIRAIR